MYIPTVRKPKIEDIFEVLGHKENKIEESSNVEPENLTKVSESCINNQKPELMDIEPNFDATTIKDSFVNMLDCSKNIDNTKVTDSKKNPILTDEDLNNFKKSISYVSII